MWNKVFFLFNNLEARMILTNMPLLFGGWGLNHSRLHLGVTLDPVLRYEVIKFVSTLMDMAIILMLG